MSSSRQLVDNDSDQDASSFSPAARNKRPAPRGTASYPRKRAVTACQVCRARRTKCDNAKPTCSFCLKTGAQCIQSPADLSSFDPASLRILQRLDELEAAIHSSTSLPDQTGGTESRISSKISSETIHLLPASVEDLLGYFRHPETETGTVQLLQLLRQPTALTPWSPAESFSADLEPRSTRLLLDNFFQYCHVKNPILDSEASTRRMVAHVSLHGVDWSPQSCITLLICALGAISTPFGDSESTSPGTTAYMASQSYFQAAQKRLGTLVATAGVIEAQCLFLAGVYSMCIFKPSNAWRYFSQALACCQEFEFIVQAAPMWRDTEAFETQPNPQRLSVAEQAIYWSSWKSEREMRQDLQPHDFFLHDSERPFYPSFFPTPPPAEEYDESMDATQSERQRTGWYFYLTEISLRRLTSRIVEEILEFQSFPGTSRLENLAKSVPSQEAKVNAWFSKLPAPVSLQTEPEYDDITRFVIRGHLNNVYEIIYGPFLDACLDDMERSSSKQASSSANQLRNHDAEITEEIQSLAEAALAKHVERIHLNKPGFKHRHHGTWPMIRSCTRSGLLVLKTANLLQRNRDLAPARTVSLPDGWQEAVLEVIALNRYWAAEVADANYRLPLLEQAWQDLESYTLLSTNLTGVREELWDELH